MFFKTDPIPYVESICFKMACNHDDDVFTLINTHFTSLAFVFMLNLSKIRWRYWVVLFFLHPETIQPMHWLIYKPQFG